MKATVKIIILVFILGLISSCNPESLSDSDISTQIEANTGGGETQPQIPEPEPVDD